VFGGSSGDLFVAWIFYLAATKARNNVVDAGEFLKVSFYTPKATAGKSRDGQWVVLC